MRIGSTFTPLVHDPSELRERTKDNHSASTTLIGSDTIDSPTLTRIQSAERCESAVNVNAPSAMMPGSPLTLIW